MNLRAVAAIYKTEMMRTGRTLAQRHRVPGHLDALYFVVFGAAIGSRISQIEGVNYGSFIVPGLIMLTLLTQSVMNASFGIYSRVSSAPSTTVVGTGFFLEITLGFVGAAASKVDHLGSSSWRPRCCSALHIAHPFWMITFMVLTSVTFSLLGFIIGIWADGFEKLQIVPLLIITPLTFLGGTSIRPACCRRCGRPSLCSIRSSTSSAASAGVLRDRRRPHRHQRGDDTGVPRPVPRRDLVDFPHRYKLKN